MRDGTAHVARFFKAGVPYPKKECENPRAKQANQRGHPSFFQVAHVFPRTSARRRVQRIPHSSFLSSKAQSPLSADSGEVQEGPVAAGSAWVAPLRGLNQFAR